VIISQKSTHSLDALPAYASPRTVRPSRLYLLRLKQLLMTKETPTAFALSPITLLTLTALLAVSGWCILELKHVSYAIRWSNENAQALDAFHRLAASVAASLAAMLLASVFAAFVFHKQIATQSRERAQGASARNDAGQEMEEVRRQLTAAEEKYRALFNHSSEAYLLLDGARLLDCNESAILMLRARGKEQIVGQSLKDFALLVQPRGDSSPGLLQRCREVVCQPGTHRFRSVYSRLDGADLHVDVRLTAIPLDGGTLTLVAWRDLTEGKEAEEALLRSAARLRVAQAIAHLGHWEYDPRTDRVLWSEEALRIFGFASPTESPTLQSCFHRIHPEDRPAAELAFAAAIGRGKSAEISFRILLPDGNIRHVDSRSRGDLNSAGKAVRVSGTILDITQQKQVEAQLRQTLAEKELLVKEVHHRVKNNLQVISSLLSMQIDLLEDEDSIQALRDSQHRISSMALIHERLCSHGNIDNVDFAEYTETLVQELFHAYGKQAQHIYKSLELAPVPLDIEKAIPCGLILNELVTNALKHAFPSGRGTLSIRLKSNSKDRLSLCVSDSGIGLPDNLDLKDSKSLGLPLVEVLARQLGGVLHVQPKPGATFTVDFPVSGVV